MQHNHTAKFWLLYITFIYPKEHFYWYFLFVNTYWEMFMLINNAIAGAIWEIIRLPESPQRVELYPDPLTNPKNSIATIYPNIIHPVICILFLAWFFRQGFWTVIIDRNRNPIPIMWKFHMPKPGFFNVPKKSRRISIKTKYVFEKSIRNSANGNSIIAKEAIEKIRHLSILMFSFFHSTTNIKRIT